MKQVQVSRRGILAMAAAGAATYALSSAGARQDPAQESGKATLRWGIIGTGTRGALTHIPVLKEAPESEISALCDVSQERLSTAAAKVPHPTATYTDYQKLLADPNVNAVVIAVPNLLHREILLAAIQSGKPILCEKPAGSTPSDATAIKQMVDSARQLIMFGMQYRNNPKARKIAELIEAGDVGRPKYIVQNCSRGDWNLSPNVWRYSDPKLGGKPMNWRFSHAASGGTLNEFSCHYLDLLHWYAGGLPERVSGDGGIAVYKDGRDTWDHASVTMKYPNGVTAVHTLSMFGPGRNDVVVMGDEGSIEQVGETFRLTRSAKRGGKRIQDITLDPPAKRSSDGATLGLYVDFLACMKTAKKPEAHVDRAAAASRTCWVAELAAERKAEVGWNDLT
jgi:predicted dehydrogenase